MAKVPVFLVDRFPREVVSVEPSSGGWVVRLRGELDHSTDTMLAEILAVVVAADDGTLIVDVGEVAFMDSAIVRVFEHTHTFLADRSRVLVVRAPPACVRQLFALCQVSLLIDAADGAACAPSLEDVRALR